MLFHESGLEDHYLVEAAQISPRSAQCDQVDERILPGIVLFSIGQLLLSII